MGPPEAMAAALAVSIIHAMLAAYSFKKKRPILGAGFVWSSVWGMTLATLVLLVHGGV